MEGFLRAASASGKPLAGGFSHSGRLINQPQVPLADEPTGNLDSRTSEEILREFQRLHRERKQTIILVTHDPTIDRWGPRTITVRDGSISGDSSGKAA
jgi:ABC-type lipoprotein export system ATPase subunit